MLFDITCENIAYTADDLDGQSLDPDQLLALNQELALAPGRPSGLLAIQSVHLSEDDDQEEDDRKLFVVIVLRLEASNERAASDQAQSLDFLTKVFDRFNALHQLTLTTEEAWEVTDSEEM